ncbi:MAG: oxidoreductase, coenzyme F420-dependent [Mycobacterium sp.]|jgi:predicted dinucleotide-binding enzyme|nr:oxidoreductase, coenzyme F420-dependent [Mycobacterium sp.]
MKIGIIGAGSIAGAVAAVATRSGHDVMVSNTRGPATLSSLADAIGCRAGTPEEAAAFGNIALVAIPLKAYHTVPVAQLEGKIVLDATNYRPERDGHINELHRDEITTSELMARHLPKSTVVKALNAITAADIESDGLPSGLPGRRALPIAGDHAVAKKVVAELLDELGYDTVDAGPLVEGRRFQKDTPAFCVPMDSGGLQATIDNTFNPLAPRGTQIAS